MAKGRTTDALRDRVGELELRVRSLERKLKPPSPVALKATPKGKPRPTCAGCLLELPKGRRGDCCVWCGFRFDAVPPIPAKKRRVSGL
jgi:hypothetical protein